MKRINIILWMILLTGSLMSQGTWTRKELPLNGNFNAIFFADSLRGWIGGDSGVFLRTTDGGENWINQSVNTFDITDIYFLNNNNGWATTLNYQLEPLGTVVLKTTNGGQTWTESNFPEPGLFMNCVLFLDSVTGWMGGSPHALVKTNDAGQTWHQAAIDTSVLAFFPVESIKFFDNNYGYASGGIFDVAGVIWRTSNGGDLWYAIDPSEAPADEVHALHLFDSLNVIGAGGDPDFGYGAGMIRTSDGGLSWIYDELGMQGTALDIDFRNNTEAWAPLGARRTMIYSLDAGTTWTEISTPDSIVIDKMTFPDSMHGFAVGKNGAFMKYNPPLTGISGKENENEMMIFPNPSKGKFTVKMPFHDGLGKIEISDLTGRKCKTFSIDKNFADIDAASLSEGIYIIKLTEDGILISARKIIISR